VYPYPQPSLKRTISKARASKKERNGNTRDPEKDECTLPVQL
jgi:hypothetical protein